MEFEVNREDIIKALGAAEKATAGKQMAVLGNVLIKAECGEVEILGYNLSLAVFARVPAAIKESGSGLLAAGQVSAFLAKCADRSVNVSTEGDKAVIKCGRSRVTFICPPADDFPEPRSIERDANEITVDLATFSSAVSAVIYAAADISSREVLQAVNISFDKVGRIQLTGCDGLRAASCKYDSGKNGANCDFNILKADLKTALQIIEGNKITIRYSKSDIEFVGEDGRTVRTKLCSADYPEVGQMMKKSFAAAKQLIKLSAEELGELLKKLLALPKESIEAPTRLNFSNDRLTVVYDFKSGCFIEEIPCELSGNPFTVGVRATFLAEMIKGATGEIMLGCDGSEGAVTLEQGHVRRMFMPMRLRNGLS